jgi:hypothetical protein
VKYSTDLDVLMKNQLLTEKNFSIYMKTLKKKNTEAFTGRDVTQYLSLMTYEAREH